MAQITVKKNAIPQAGDNTGKGVEGQQTQQTTDENYNLWVRIAGGASDSPFPVFISAAATDAALLGQRAFYTQMLNEWRDIRKILALMAIDQGVSLPDELGDVFRDDVAA